MSGTRLRHKVVDLTDEYEILQGGEYVGEKVSSAVASGINLAMLNKVPEGYTVAAVIPRERTIDGDSLTGELDAWAGPFLVLRRE